MSKAGSDWEEIRVRDVATGKDRADLLRWVKFSGASWTKDGSGFFYCRYDEPKEGAALTEKNEFHKLYFHKLGTPQSEDRLVYERKDHPEWGFDGWVTDDGGYLIIHVGTGHRSEEARLLQGSHGTDGKESSNCCTDVDATYDFIDN